MFDVGLSEVMVIAVVALVVIGPERLPRVARAAGLLLGRLQRYVSDVKADINREIQLDELKKLQQQVAEQAGMAESSASREILELEASLNNTIAPPQMPSAAPSTAQAAVSPTGPEESALGVPAFGDAAMPATPVTGTLATSGAPAVNSTKS